jgi:lysine 6-dehydrogenase
MAHIVVLGGGLVGRVMALDLARDKDLRLTVVDRDSATLGRVAKEGLATKQADLSDPKAVTAAIKDADVVVGAVPGFLGFMVLRTVIEAGKPYADIAFMPEDALELDDLAKKHGVTAVVDCGVAPGLSNLLCGRGAHLLDHAETMLILVGGLPKRRVWPFEYRIVFSAVDVIEEYTRTARWVEHGKLVTKAALTDPELIDLPHVGTVEAFNTDGLRSLATTLHAPFMKEKTLRFPGHIEKMRMLRETGFFSTKPIKVGGTEVRPFDVTTKLLFDAWKLPEGDADLTVMRVEVSGTKGGKPVTYTWDLYDEYDPKTGYTSMARTTGFPNVIVARMLARGELRRPGVIPPELLGGDDRFFDTMLEGLRQRGVELKLTTR